MMAVLEAGHRSPWQRFLNPAIPRIPLDAVMQVSGEQEHPDRPLRELEVYGMAGSFEGGYAAAGWAETRGRSQLHFVLMLEGTRVPLALIRTQMEVLIREIADTSIP
jgi:hypothetical protein